MTTGKVKKVILDKGYGFISPAEGGGDIFFHHSAVQEARLEDLSPGQQVTFELTQGPDGKGPRALNVRRG